MHREVRQSSPAEIRQNFSRQNPTKHRFTRGESSFLFVFFNAK